MEIALHCICMNNDQINFPVFSLSRIQSSQCGGQLPPSPTILKSFSIHSHLIILLLLKFFFLKIKLKKGKLNFTNQKKRKKDKLLNKIIEIENWNKQTCFTWMHIQCYLPTTNQNKKQQWNFCCRWLVKRYLYLLLFYALIIIIIIFVQEVIDLQLLHPSKTLKSQSNCI